MSPSRNYGTRNKYLKTIQANNMRGERSLLCTGVKLYNKHLLEGWAGFGCDPTENFYDYNLIDKPLPDCKFPPLGL